MSNIYTEAKEVLIFLGKDGDVFEKSVISLAKTVRTYQAGSLDNPPNWPAFINSTNEVFSAPWFSRVWVIQEAALAKEPVIVCGKASVPFDDIVGVSTVIHGNIIEVTAKMQDSEVPFRQGWLRLSHMFVDARTKLDKLQLRPVQAFMNAVERARDSNCHDPRDHVLGLFGLAVSLKIDPKALEIGYEQTITDVFTRTAKYFMDDFDAPLQALVSSNHESEITTSEPRPLNEAVKPDELPSWVPNYTRRANVRFREAIYASGGKAELHARLGKFEVRDCMLISRGILVGDLDLVFDIGSGTVGQWHQAEELFTRLDAEVESRNGAKHYGEHVQRLNSHRRAVMADSVFKSPTYKRIDDIYSGDAFTGLLNYTFVRPQNH